MKPVPEEPRCPYCYHRIEQPKELKERKFLEFPVGLCEHCGAVYAYDVTGHNMGAAFIEALLFACNFDSDLAFSLSHGQDYTDAVVEQYDLITHTITPEKIYNDRFVRGVLIFVKLIDEFKEVTEKEVKARIKTSQPLMKTRLRSGNFSREKVKEYVLNNNQEALLSLALEDSRVINELQRMLYTPDEDLRWRIIDLLGKVCGRVGTIRPDIVSKFLSRLIQSAASPAASAWGSLEAAATIISTNTDLYGEFGPALLAFLQQKDLRKEVAWAIGKVATADPGTVRYAHRALRSFLQDQDPAVRGYAAWSLGALGYSDALDDLLLLESDDEELSLWRDGHMEHMTVGMLAKEAIGKLTQ